MNWFPFQRGTSCRRGRCVSADAKRDGIAAEPPPGAGGEQRIGGEPVPLGQPGPQQGLGRAGEGNRALLAALTFAADIGSDANSDVAAVQACEFGDSQAGLDGQQHQGTVATSFPP